MDFEQQVSLRNSLFESSHILGERHLYQSSKWLNEALNGMVPFTSEQQYAEFQLSKRSCNSKKPLFNVVNSPVKSQTSVFGHNNNNTSGSCSAVLNSGIGPSLGLSSSIASNTNTGSEIPTGTGISIQSNSKAFSNIPYEYSLGDSSPSIQDEYLQFTERNNISLASSYFHCKEFNRCYSVLKNCKSTQALFLRLYALYLNGEKKKSIQHGTVLGQNDTNSQNPNFSLIVKDLETYKANMNISHLSDPFLLYLQGLIFLKTKKLSHAQEMFYQSLSLYPMNWSCWKDLISSLSTFSEALRMISRLQKNTKFTDNKEYYIMFLFFKVTVYQEFFQISSEIVANINELTDIFPNFSFLKTQKALIAYNELDYTTAENIFDDILKTDPMRLDEMDIYSNILYVMENKSKLSYLAHHAYEIDSLRPETCCIIANYHSIKFDHQKAIMYYKRALSLSQDCLSAWTLMGHEFVELKNSNAAIESYRRAVDTNSKDFRAWYGLGQAYEVLDMHLYSLYYYQRACALKPMDKRMWQAIGNCCEKLEEFEDSIKAYKKAASVSIDFDLTIMYKLGILYSLIDDTNNAKMFMKLCLDEELNGDITDETCKARIWLAKYEMSNKNWNSAYNYASELTQGSSQEIEEARAIAREARIKMNTSSSISIGVL